jgi:hypothetical protein
MSVELAFERDFTLTRPIRESIRISLDHARRSLGPHAPLPKP